MNHNNLLKNKIKFICNRSSDFKLPSYVVVEPLDHVDHTVYLHLGDNHALAFSFVFEPLDPNDSKYK